MFFEEALKMTENKKSTRAGFVKGENAIKIAAELKSRGINLNNKDSDIYTVDKDNSR